MSGVRQIGITPGAADYEFGPRFVAGRLRIAHDDSVVIVRVELKTGHDLLQISGTRCGAGAFSCQIQRGQQHRGEDRDDRDNDKKFDQGEIPFHGTVSVGLVEHLFKLYRRTAAMSITRNLFPESFMTES